MDDIELKKTLERYGLTRFYDLLDARVRKKEDYVDLVETLNRICKKARRRHFLSRHSYHRSQGRSYQESVEFIAEETGWSPETIRKKLKKEKN